MISHIGFIMDGNRRFAKKNNLPLKEGYEEGMLQFYKVVKWQVQQNIHTTTFFALSLDNSKKRKKEELQTIKSVITKLLENPKFEKFCFEHSIKIQIKGRYFQNNKVNEEILKLDSKEINKKELFEMKKNEEELIRNVEKKVTQLNSSIQEPNFIVNIALFYDGQDEIAAACQKISKLVLNKELSIQDITPEIIKKHLYLNDSNSPEIIVRTGAAPRLSGFMLFDSAYSELYLTEKMWPELNEESLNGILEWFDSQNRNFGK